MHHAKPSRARGSRWQDEQGSAALEFIAVGLVLLVPLVYLVLTLGTIQQHTLGAEAAARHTARAMTQASTAHAAAVRADTVLSSVIAAYQMDPERVSTQIACAPRGTSCPSAGAILTVRVETAVALPFMPELFGLARHTAIPVHAEAVQKVSRQWNTR